jgi:hypothetical protein
VIEAKIYPFRFDPARGQGLPHRRKMSSRGRCFEHRPRLTYFQHETRSVSDTPADTHVRVQHSCGCSRHRRLITSQDAGRLTRGEVGLSPFRYERARALTETSAATMAAQRVNHCILVDDALLGAIGPLLNSAERAPATLSECCWAARVDFAVRYCNLSAWISGRISSL